MSAAGERAPIDLIALAVEAGWSASPREDGGAAVDLDVPEAYFAAELTAAGARVRGTARLAWIADAPAGCRRAALRLLARAGEVVTDVVPVLDVAGARFAVECAAEAVALDGALGALTVACRLFGRELELVQRSPALAALLEGAASAAPPRANAPPRRLAATPHPNPEEVHP